MQYWTLGPGTLCAVLDSRSRDTATLLSILENDDHLWGTKEVLCHMSGLLTISPTTPA